MFLESLPRPTRTLAIVWREEAFSHAARAFRELLVAGS
jgi:hypothetical protein